MKNLVLDSVSSPITKRVYNMALNEFFAWYRLEMRPGFCKATVSAWRVYSLEVRGLGSSSIIIRMSAIRKLAVEATDNGLLAPELAAGIARVKSAKSIGIRTGNWLSLKQAQALLNAPDGETLKGLRDRAIIAVLLGCGLRRSEIAALTMRHVQQRDGRWCIVDLVGKHSRIRTVPMPAWVKIAINAWTTGADVVDGYVFRPVHRGDQVQGDALSEKKLCGSYSYYTRPPLASLASRLMTVVAQPRSYAAPRGGEREHPVAAASCVDSNNPEVFRREAGSSPAPNDGSSGGSQSR
jgi:integrase